MSRRIVLSIFGALAIGAIGIGFAGCSDDDEPSEADATTAFCADLSEYGASLAALGDLSATSTIDEVEAAQEDIESAHADLQDSAEGIAEARLDDLDAAYDDLISALNDVSGGDTLGEASTTIAASTQAVEAARADLNDAVSCP